MARKVRSLLAEIKCKTQFMLLIIPEYLDCRYSYEWYHTTAKEGWNLRLLVDHVNQQIPHLHQFHLD